MGGSHKSKQRMAMWLPLSFVLFLQLRRYNVTEIVSDLRWSQPEPLGTKGERCNHKKNQRHSQHIANIFNDGLSTSPFPLSFAALNDGRRYCSPADATGSKSPQQSESQPIAATIGPCTRTSSCRDSQRQRQQNGSLLGGSFHSQAHPDWI